jgi:predicted RNA-binding protein with PIN domain
MIIVIDGYNVLKQLAFGKYITDQERATFIAQLGRYGKIKHHEIIVVFDGGPSEWLYKERINGVLIIYPGPVQTADDYIKTYLKRRHNHELLLVSNDGELNERAARLAIPSIDVMYFYQLVKEALIASNIPQKATDQSIIKLSQEENPDLDELMRQASKKVSTKREDIISGEVQSWNGNPRTLSKEERSLVKKLKKL